MKNKESLFSKSNYDIQFEEMLEQKGYSDEAKSLVLNIVYKIESSYGDYKQAKHNVKPKMEIIEDIIDTIENRCDEIEIINPKQKRSKIQINRKNKIIKIFPNDNDLLQAMYFIKTPYTDKIENVFEKAVLIALENGMAVNGAEVIRDFNGWSWNNVLSKELEQYYNLIYQDLIILIGESEIERIIRSHNVLEELIKALKHRYGKQNAEEFMRNFMIASLLIFMNTSKKSSSEVLDYLVEKDSEFSELLDKPKYISEINKQINENTEIACKVDTLLNSPKALEKKYSTKKISEKYKDVDSYKVSLIKYKNQVLNEIAKQKKMMNPFEYINEKNRLEQEINILKVIKDNYAEKEIIPKYLIELQKKFASCFLKKIEVYDLKKELTGLIYEVRYWESINLGGKPIRQFKTLKNDIDKIQINLINKLKKAKIVDIFSSYERANYLIIKYIFESRCLNLGKISMRFKVNGDGADIEYFDEKMVENSTHIKLNDEERAGFIKKENKKMKIII